MRKRGASRGRSVFPGALELLGLTLPLVTLAHNQHPFWLWKGFSQVVASSRMPVIL
jgi:hypothetical protein